MLLLDQEPLSAALGKTCMISSAFLKKLTSRGAEFFAESFNIKSKLNNSVLVA